MEIEKILNLLGHGVSYSKICEIETASASQKISKSTVIIPENIQMFIPTTLVFDNIDQLEETLSGSGTTHRVNGIAVQRFFIGLLLPKFKDIPKTKQRSIDVPIIEIPINVGKKPDAPFFQEEILTMKMIQHRLKTLFGYLFGMSIEVTNV